MAKRTLHISMTGDATALSRATQAHTEALRDVDRELKRQIRIAQAYIDRDPHRWRKATLLERLGGHLIALYALWKAITR
jgi:hypothetical protein